MLDTNVICTLAGALKQVAEALNEKTEELERLRTLTHGHEAMCDEVNDLRREVHSLTCNVVDLTAEVADLEKSLRIAEDKLDASFRVSQALTLNTLMDLFATPQKLYDLQGFMQIADRASKIANIKRVREITEWGLLEAKNFVEAYPPAPVGNWG